MIRRLVLSVLVLVFSCGLPAMSWAAGASVVVSEIQTGSTTLASQEFIELQNISAAAVDLSGWHIEYKSATSPNTASSWTKHADLSGSLAAGDYYLVATKGYLANTDAVWSDGLASSGGHVRLVDSRGLVVDVVGYGNANSPETAAASAPAAGKSISRKVDAAGIALDSDNNSADFDASATSTPKGATALAGPTNPSPSTPPGASPTPILPPAAGTAGNYDGLLINELYIDPASPLSDAKDEFIELFNTSGEAINIGGLKLQCGSNFHDSYTLPAATTIVASGYLALYSSTTKLALTNSGGAARLVTATGQVIDASTSYSAAPSGQTWSSFEEGWRWTVTATPGATNIFTQPASAAKSSASSSSSKATSSKSSTSKVAAAAKAAKATASKTVKDVATASAALAENPAAQNNGRWLLGGLAGLTMGYGLYEYRHHIYNFIEISKRYLRARRKAS